MSVESTNSGGDAALTNAEEQQEFQNLPALLSQWKKIQEEKRNLQQQKKVLAQQVREHDKRCAAMEVMIMGTMKKNSIGAIDLKSSNARVLYKKRTTKAPLAKDDLLKHVSEYMKSQDEAKKFIGFLKNKQLVKVKESLFYEKNEVAE